ncbi:MAG: sulfatase [Pseudarcicella sp.]|nr:sulfatase [Pseudarcicella sp.]MBP6409733.1 sulfatase [Pseudarcicella sp.]
MFNSSVFFKCVFTFGISFAFIFSGCSQKSFNASSIKSSTDNNTASSVVTKPNIILIFADDLGFYDTGFNGSKVFETPVLDALSKKSLVFDQAYAGAGNCAPSRGCLMSGLYTPRHGIYAVGSTLRGPVAKMKTVPVANTEYLRSDIVTIAESMKANGYATSIYGKWHLGEEPTTVPTAQGFDDFFDSRLGIQNTKLDKPDDPKGIYSLTKSTIDFISTNKDKPFFTIISHHAIHSHLEARPSSIAKFIDKGLSANQALYAGCIYDLDHSVGLILAKLKELGLEENTLIVFTSDNGSTGQSSQEPLRGNKGCYYEGGIRVPFLAYWPSRIKAGVNHSPVINLDLYPTFTAIGGKQTLNLDGENILPILEGTKANTTRDKLFWHFPGYLNEPVTRGRDNIFRTRPVTTMRKGNWKIHLYHEEFLANNKDFDTSAQNATELFDLQNDAGERTNLALLNMAKNKELLSEVMNWLDETKAPLPTLK